MTPTRRMVLGAAAAAPIALTLRPAAAASDGGGAATQVTGVQRFTVGDHVVTALLDGHLGIPAGMFANLSGDEAQSLLQQAFRQEGPVPTGINAYVVQGGGETVLIDTGARGFRDGLGHMFEAMEMAGVAPGDVTRVLITHLHPDHVGGMAQDGTAEFPNATVHLHQIEADFWSSNDNKAKAPEGQHGFFENAQQKLAAYGDRVKPFANEGELIGGIRSIFLPGHTPGHTGYQIGEGPDALTVWGDIVHVGVFQFPKPEAAIGFDIDPDQAVETRKMMFAKAADQGLRIAGMHLAFPGVGRVAKADQGYRFEPEPWTFAIE